MDMYHAQTRTLTVDSTTPEPGIIAEAAQIIQAGGLVAFPTETVYGLGANALNAGAVQRIYQAKQRPQYDPIIAHVCTVHDLPRLARDIPPQAYKLAQMFWAGPLTLVLLRADNAPANLATGLPTIAIRMPAHPVARALITAAGVPIAAPSANTFTRPSSTTAAHVLEDLDGHVDLILDGGETHIGIESTVIDMTQRVPVVLRPGGVLLDDLRQVIPEVQLMQKNEADTDENTPLASPGMLTKHYSPRAELLLYDGERNAVLNHMRETASALIAEHKRVGILTTNEEAAYFVNTGARIISMGTRSDLTQIAHVLFGAMRALDNQSVDKILVRAYDRDGIGEAIWDRLLRAAEGHVCRV
jgi:L-threonylcarbamoyladenylate synthase